MLHALDAATGKTVFTRKLPTEEGAEPPNFFASPALVGPCILVCDDTGCTWVLAPGRAFKQLAINYLDSASGACPTPDAARLLLRGETTLTCIAYGR